MAVVIRDLVEVEDRLGRFGLTREDLLEVVSAMALARSNCTENDPPSAPGWSSWRDGTRRLREVALPLGWEKDDTENVSSIINRRLGLRIAVANTDDATGLHAVAREPQNCAPKGAATDRLVNSNQGSFIDVLDASVAVVPLKPRRSTGLVTWYLCVFCNGDEVRAELSCPVEVHNGFFRSYVERIVLLGPDHGEEVITQQPDSEQGGGAEFEIPVSRK